MPRKNTDHEGPIQRGIVQYLRTCIPGNPIIAHVPNAIGLSGADVARQIAKNTFNGMVTGFPDIIGICNAGIFFLEVKSATGRLTGAQEAVHLDIRRMGHRIAVVRSIEDVQAALDAWGIWTSDRPSRRAAE